MLSFPTKCTLRNTLWGDPFYSPLIFLAVEGQPLLTSHQPLIYEKKHIWLAPLGRLS